MPRQPIRGVVDGKPRISTLLRAEEAAEEREKAGNSNEDRQAQQHQSAKPDSAARAKAQNRLEPGAVRSRQAAYDNFSVFRIYWSPICHEASDFFLCNFAEPTR